MTHQMNQIALIANGYAHVATYKMFSKYDDGSWEKPFEYECFQKDSSCVIKISFGRKSFTKVFESKQSANNFIVNAIKKSDSYKRVM